MKHQEIREKLISAGIRNMVEFGYPDVTSETILTDNVYKLFFKSMLEQNLGNSKVLDEVINGLLADINKTI